MRRGHERASADSLVVAVLALVGLRLGLSPVSDNSAFTHLATGIQMVADGLVPEIPRVDPYTFTARGHEWVVQSWLPSAAVGWVYRLVGEHGVMILSGLAMGATAWLIATLARTGHALRTALAGGCALSVGAVLWAPRPLMVGLLCLALTVLVVERGGSPWWLVPIVWVWVNSHGSFPLGVAWVVLATVGARLDRREISLRYGTAFAVGLAAAAVNPLGPKLLAFPLTALQKSEVFGYVVEWQSPDFRQPVGLTALIGVAVAVAIMTRARVPWRDVLPVVAFIAAGLVAQRNLPALGVVLAPALGRALRKHDAEPVRLAPDRFWIVAAGLAIAGLVIGADAVRSPLIDSSRNPVAAIVWLEENGRFDAPHRVVAPDTVGNYLELRHGARGEVFIDDRVDMFPESLVRDYVAMRGGEDRGIRALDRWNADTVLWRADEAFAQRLDESPEWSVAVRRQAWVVLIRRTD